MDERVLHEALMADTQNALWRAKFGPRPRRFSLPVGNGSEEPHANKDL